MHGYSLFQKHSSWRLLPTDDDIPDIALLFYDGAMAVIADGSNLYFSFATRRANNI
jgi:hypothetical protein